MLLIVTLRSVNLATSARYRCEVSAEAPLFNTVSQSKKLQVGSRVVNELL